MDKWTNGRMDKLEEDSLKQIVVFWNLKTWDGLFAFLVRGFVQIFGQVIAIRVKTLTNTNLVSRDIKWEKALYPVDMSCQSRLCLSSLFYKEAMTWTILEFMYKCTITFHRVTDWWVGALDQTVKMQSRLTTMMLYRWHASVAIHFGESLGHCLLCPIGLESWFSKH